MKLSHREHTVFTLIACGLTDNEAAIKLKIYQNMCHGSLSVLDFSGLK